MIKVPKHVAIILDGNGRWATKRGLPRIKGHEEGAKTLKKVAVHAMKRGIKVLSVYAFSTENFNRSEEEVNFLMKIFTSKFKAEIPFFNKHNIKVLFSGRKEQLKLEVLQSMEELKRATDKNTGVIFNVCLNYGGQSEIVDAAKKIVKKVINKDLDVKDLNENTFYRYLYNYLPPVDLLIRTSGEIRVSNFMLYQISYAEMYFPEVCFPDFNEKEFDKALEEYTKRDRRFGKIKNNN